MKSILSLFVAVSCTLFAQTALSQTVSILAQTPVVTEGSDISYVITTSTNVTGSPLTVYLKKGPGTAIEGVHYTLPTPMSVTIPINSRSAVLTVPTLDAGGTGDGKTVTIELLEPGTGINSATATIAAASGLPVVSITASATQGNEGEKVTLTIARTGSTAGNLTVNLTPGGSATEGTDYTAIPRSVVLVPGIISTTIEVTLIADAVIESPEAFSVSIAADAAYTVSPTAGAVGITIFDGNQPGVSITTSATQADEGETVVLTVARTGSTVASLTVRLLVGGSATENADYTAIQRSVVLVPGVASALFEVDLIDDLIAESPESIAISIIADATYTVSPTQGAVGITITDTIDRSQPTVSISTSTTQVDEGQNVTLTLSRTGSVVGPLTVQLNAVGTATEGSDYTAIPRIVTLEAGEDAVDISVSIVDDFIRESAEAFQVSIVANPSAYSVGSPNSVFLTITDTADVFAPNIRIKSQKSFAKESGGSGKLKVFRSHSRGALSVFYTVGGSAKAGEDYKELSGLATFRSGKKTATIKVKPIDDKIKENTERATVTLQPSNSYFLQGNRRASVRILDDERERNFRGGVIIRDQQ